MAQTERDNRIVIEGSEVRHKLLEGAQAAYGTVTTTFGPKGQNVLIEKPFGRPVLTRDGVTVARDTYFKDRAKNMGAQLVLEASETTNRIAGDGTTATVALTYHLMKNGSQAIDDGMHPMQVKQTLMDDSYVLLERLEELSAPTKKNQLVDVATVSSGDALLGQLIAEAIDHVGPDGGIITEKSHIQDVEREYVDGYYLQTGFEALQTGRKEMVDPFVVVSTRRLSSTADAIEILTKVAQAKGLQPGNIPRILFIGNIEDAAYNVIVDNINRGTIDAIIIKTPIQFGNMGKQLLEDIAVYADCAPISDSTNLKTAAQEFERYVGSVDRVVASKTESTLFSASATEAIEFRVKEIKDQLELETVDAITEKLRDRVAKLQGKIALFRIGGATETEKEEKEFRVEDAILATRAAYTEGVVPGGATTLVELSKCEVSDITRKSLQDTFKKLLLNASLNPEVKLAEVLEAPFGHGFNLREDGELVDMVKSGVLDPKLVVENIVRNSATVAANALTTGTILNFQDKEE